MFDWIKKLVASEVKKGGSKTFKFKTFPPTRHLRVQLSNTERDIERRTKSKFAGQPSIKINKVHKDFLREWRVEYLDKLAPPEIFDMGFVIAGGCLRNMVRRDEPISDVDCFLLNSENHTQKTLDTISKLIGRDFKPLESELDRDPRVWDASYQGHKLQVIYPKVTFSIQNMLERFDFCTVQWAYDGDYLYYTDQAVVDCSKKEITINYIKRKRKAFARLAKYTGKGYDARKAAEVLGKMPDEAADEMYYFL